MNRKLKIFFLVSFLTLINVPLVLCVTSEPIIYVSGNGSGNFTCDGIDDHVQINEALQLAAENSSYTTVYLKGPFTYSINDTLLIGSNTTLEGDSNVKIKLVNNASWEASKPMIMEKSLNNHDIAIRGFTIDGNREGNTNVVSGKGYYNLIHLSYCKNISVHDMYLTNNHGDGLKTDSCSNIIFYGNKIYGLGHDALYASSCSYVEAYDNIITCRTNSGLRLYNTNHASFYNNTITSENTGGSGIEIQKYGTPAMNDIEVYNNTIYRTALAGIWIFGSGPSYSLSSANLHIHHNRIYGTGTKKSSPTAGGIVSSGFNALVENNVFDGCYGSAISQKETYSTVPGSGYVITARNNIITNTRFSSAGGSGYGVYNLLTGTHSFVLQNNCFHNNTGGDYEGTQASPSNIEVYPEYADRNKNDYHLKSKTGRWNGSSWVNDSRSSPCIDTGYKFSDYSAEPEDNGDRVNIGSYGNTKYASKSGNSKDNNIQAPNFTEIQITTNYSDQCSPSIYRDRIVGNDNRNGNSEIYIYNISTSTETQITTNESWASNPAIYGNRIVWEDGRNGNSDIYMYNLSTSNETQITTNKSWASSPAVYDDRIIWDDNRNGNSDIYMYNLSTSNETQVAANESDQTRPTIFGDRIVWQDSRKGNWDIYMYEISTSSETQISSTESDQVLPAIYSDRIVWQDARSGNWDIYMYNISTSMETRITTNESDQCNPVIYGDRIVWNDNRNGNSDVYIYNISTNETKFTTNESWQGSPAIYEDRIVWNDGRNGNSDIYMCNVSLEKTEAKKPVANFTSNVTSGTEPLNVRFNDTSTGIPTSWNWSFGDATTNSTLRNPTHNYSKAGNYTLRLTVSNSAGSNTTTKTSYIKVLATKPVASFTSNVSSGTAPLIVAFNDTSTGSPTLWKWSFGDGTTNSTIKNPMHNYSKAGNYTLILTVGNAAGNNTTTKSNYIKVAAVQKPVANFSSNVTSGTAPLNVSFKDTSTGTPTSWKWSFGDGVNATVKNPTHNYSKAGNYTLILTVSNSAGSNAVTKSSYIKVAAAVQKPVANFSSNVVSGTQPLNVAFNDKSTGTPIAWNWTFGDGTYSAVKNPTHTYSSAGNYTVTLTATNAAGSNTVTKSSYIKVTAAAQKPIAAFSASPTSGKVPLKVLFTDKSRGSPTSWVWNFGDGITSSTRNATHTYTKKGKFTVTLTAKNASGSSTKTLSGYITVS